MSKSILESLFAVIKSRKNAPAEESYTASLFAKGENKILGKIGEELTELVMAAVKNDQDNIVYECADVLYHMLVLLAHKDLEWDAVEKELARRVGTSGLTEKAQRKK